MSVKPRTLKDVVAEAFYRNTPGYCSLCEEEINYAKFGDPIGDITKAVREFYKCSEVNIQITYTGKRFPTVNKVMKVFKNSVGEIVKKENFTPDRSVDEFGIHSYEFNWGYGGSSAAQLALALLLDATDNKEIARSYYQDFKWQIVATWGNLWAITQEEILGWVNNQKVLQEGATVSVH